MGISAQESVRPANDAEGAGGGEPRLFKSGARHDLVNLLGLRARMRARGVKSSDAPKAVRIVFGLQVRIFIRV